MNKIEDNEIKIQNNEDISEKSQNDLLAKFD